jgi:hypothetical protein
MICAVEAAWSWNQRNENLGIPKDANPNEGWIVSQEL